MKDKYNMTQEQNVFLAKRNIVDNVYINARIEGINITFPQTQAILAGANVASLNIDEIQCILNLRDAWRFITNSMEDEFDLEFICKVNEYVARNESLNWGVLREGNVGISGTEYVPEIPIEKDVINKINEINKIENVTERAIEYMLYGMRAQLFWDGNKRTSTICANFIMIKNGKGIIRIPDNKLEEFSVLLRDYYNTNNKDKIKQFIYDNCIEGITFNN